ncbi:hypothetical protein BK128_09730 [Viridibacillus sp. FSL H7-0596]|uniref:tail fiber protein n=1 Tax=Viridibacillus sp. FSL H7-0596 TaxID=1928923 RepID=UPI00096EF69B|nr:tail fiber protein [Viridibacillus sp. FSL H7-0596]OMC86934.1 hypothetical protein BK128_09730 [Viridibacillus sp. FSL H7-0596]
MAEKFSFFDPVEDENGQFDREYNAQEFTDYFGSLITTGVMKGAGNQLSVSADGSSMVTKLNTGVAFVEDKYYANDSLLNHTHDTETVGKSRIDRIVIRKDLSTEARHVKSFIKKGVASASPVAPALTQTANVYEISVAQVKVVGGQTFISANNVVDERGTGVTCPWAGSRILPSFDDNALAEHIIKKATTTQEGHVLLTNSTNSTSTTQAATANALKTVNDKLLNVHVSDNLLSIGNGSKGNLAIGYGSDNTESEGSGLAIGWQAVATGWGAAAIGGFTSALSINQGVLGVAKTAGMGQKSWIVPGDFSVKGTKNFEIPHPAPNKKDTHVIRHGAVESPTTGDTLYRYEIEATEDSQVVELHLPDYFEHLNTNVDIWVNPHLHFGRAFGVIEGNILKVTCEKAGTYKALIIGTRNDENVQDWYIKGVEREIGESWLGETIVFEVDELTEVTEFEEVMQ